MVRQEILYRGRPVSNVYQGERLIVVKATTLVKPCRLFPPLYGLLGKLRIHNAFLPTM